MSTSGVGTTTTAAAQSTLNSGLSTIANNYTSFLQLLTTQLQNQDPLSPMDTDQFTQQITEMTGVQQQLLSNQLLQTLVNQSQGGVTTAVGLIGKTATGSGATAMLENGAATFTYTLPSQAAKVIGTVTDSTGTVIWSGENSTGTAQTSGNLYNLTLTATNAAGQAVTPTTTVSGTVSAVQSINGQTMVTIGSDQVPLSSVTGVTG
jgi:flagellar basal-body rod modification protein FlgD